MKRFLSWALVLTMMLSLAACGQKTASSESASAAESSQGSEVSSVASSEPAKEAEQVKLNIFAAASMTETLKKLEQKYETAHPNVDLVFTFDSSGTLKTQIQEGAECDLFISASPKQMNAIDSSKSGDKNPDGLDFVQQGSRVDLLENKVTLCVARDNPAGINAYEDLARALKSGKVLLAIGNSDVPVGQYSLKIFKYFDVDEQAVASKLTYGSNVKEVTTAVREGTADCGIIYATDAFSAGLTPVATATAQMCGRVIYPAAVMKASKHQAEAGEFLSYLGGDEAKAEFEAVGFTVLKK